MIGKPFKRANHAVCRKEKWFDTPLRRKEVIWRLSNARQPMIRLHITGQQVFVLSAYTPGA
jgi:hypothetical protein